VDKLFSEMFAGSAAAGKLNHHFWLFSRRGFPSNLPPHMKRRLHFYTLLLCLGVPR
jgi:hypothetical protein